MPAYAKVSLVTPVFHPSDIAFARAWSEAAPGFGGWRAEFDRGEASTQISVVPPGSNLAVFTLCRDGNAVLLRRREPDGGSVDLRRFDGLREALLALCPLGEDALESINEFLDESFPRREGR